jgi:threonine aldolase
MFSFQNDYSEGAHPDILAALEKTNFVQTPGYGEDDFTKGAAALIRREIGRTAAAVQFLVGGTQANLTAIGAFLRPHQAALCAQCGHIYTHETGAVEATGHKVLPLAAQAGKMSARQIADAADAHRADATHEHIAQPKLVYLSQATEEGTVYTKAELEAIAQVCREKKLILFIDGARLGNALCAEGADLTLPELAALCDAFTIGGTKNGALFGEALVIMNAALGEDFRYLMKQRGAMLAKGRLLGVQFTELFRDGLYYRLARHANEMAQLLLAGIEEKGYRFLSHSPTNQIFPVFPNDVLEKLRRDFVIPDWEKIDGGHTQVRLVTSWATPAAQAEAFLKALPKA